ncbi:MAG: RagB/SusD family nutrient uptake outer membrane protein, partial [Bacteroides sp.]|nr:RagB/SusD family nutrient uptake outer membrane protein [Bacteroides sp.]
MRWRGEIVFVGKIGRGAYLGEDGVLYKSFSDEKKEALSTVLKDGNGWMDPLQELIPNGYQFNQNRDYLLPIPPNDVKLNKLLKQNPGW